MSELDIAIIGMAGRFPEASDVEQFWENILGARECATTFSRETLLAAGMPADAVDGEGFAGVRGVLGESDRFDASFFGYSPREAEYMDPQHRIFLEVAWNAFENAGYAPDGYTTPVGVFASCSQNTYRDTVLRDAFGDGDWKDGMLLGIGNQADFLSTRVSYKLNLTGPSMTVQTACSSSLVALHLACQSLLAGECDVALTGGSAVRFPVVGGQRWVEGGVYSPDGRCRAYTVDARGVFSGNGVAAVVLKRLDDALSDGDWIHGVVKASAVNNDGHDKIGYTAPSETGQAAAMRAALSLAGIRPDDVGYIEGHGTGTPLGDRIEIAALRSVYGTASRDDAFCALGSVKSNVGHLDAAAGVTGLIKAVLTVRNGIIPPQLHLTAPNTQLDGGPFYVTGELRPWSADIRIAGVNSLGLGGTNAHVIVAQAPERPAPAPGEGIGGYFVAPLSAGSADALDRMLDDLPGELAAVDPSLTPADASATLIEGRSPRPHRAALIGRDLSGFTRTEDRYVRDVCGATDAEVAFMYGGGGTQYAGMARQLLESDRVFRAQMEVCRTAFRAATGIDVIDNVLTGEPDYDDPVVGLSAIFLVQVALARTFLERGVRPTWQLGHSLGEYTAAVIGGSVSLEDGLRLVIRRAELFAKVKGGMLSVFASAEWLRAGGHLDTVSLAAVNADDICTLSGHRHELEKVAARLAALGVEAKMVPIATPAHSSLLEPILHEFGEVVRMIRFTAPKIPWISNTTGRFITTAELADPDYWVRHMRETVRFGEGVATLLDAGARTFLEIGPGRPLGGFVRAVAGERRVRTFGSMRHAGEPLEDGAVLALAFAQLHLAGVRLDPGKLYGREVFRRVPLRGTVFDRVRHWPAVGPAAPTGGVLADPASWLTMPSWVRLPRIRAARPLNQASLMFAGEALPGADGPHVASGEELRALVRGSVHLVIAPGGDAALVTELVSAAVDAVGPAQVGVSLVLTSAVAVDDGDEIVPERYGVVSALRVLAQENAGLSWQAIDLCEMSAWRAEIGEPADRALRAVRPSGRWGQALVPANVGPPTREFRRSGTYVFTGGVGRFSLHLAWHLCADYDARVVLTSRSGAPDRLDELTAAALQRLQTSYGDRVEIARCDVGDQDALAALFDRVAPVAGVFHAAAVTTGPSMRVLGEALRAEHFHMQHRPKLHGAEALAKVVGEADFCLLFSSNASRFGGPGLAAYAAANAALEAFAESRWLAGDERWLAATWDGWRLAGEPERKVRTELDRFALAPEESLRMIEAIVTGARSAVTVVSKMDVHIRHERWIASVAPTETPPPEEMADPVFADHVETEVARLWREVLGVATVGREDTFFQLGGHSLMGLRLISRIKDRFRVGIQYALLVQLDTVAKMAAWIKQSTFDHNIQATPASRSKTLSQLLKKVTSVQNSQ
ncbi:beta-ketoacyl synthase N-terminal-like domain-containing protein [Sphaerisporangium sp. NPDC051017]|uniref:type I polyketide synthase n=1 Tax=Sphaerisporangium sp. NPDC051017 TaxID=3154636 RepID=UPI00341B6AC7